MAKAFAEIKKFKRVEEALRNATNSFRDAIAETDQSIGGSRTAVETEFLSPIRVKVVEGRSTSREIVGDLVNGTLTSL